MQVSKRIDPNEHVVTLGGRNYFTKMELDDLQEYLSKFRWAIDTLTNGLWEEKNWFTNLTTNWWKELMNSGRKIDCDVFGELVDIAIDSPPARIPGRYFHF